MNARHLALTALLLVGPAHAQSTNVTLPPGMTLPTVNADGTINMNPAPAPFPIPPMMQGLLQSLPADLTKLIDPEGICPSLFSGQIQLPNGIICPLPWTLAPLVGGGGAWTGTAPLIAHRPLAGQPVDRYSCMQVLGHACRIPTNALPIKIYTPFAHLRPVAQQAMDLWNRVGLQSPQAKPFFVQVDTPETAQLVVDWTGAGLPEGVAGRTYFDIRPQVVEVRGISLRDVPNCPPGEVSETLAHELGHSLGLDHSDDPQDLMYKSQVRLYTKPDSQVSSRDSWMLRWLYSQPGTVPMLPSASPRPKA